MHSNCEEDMEKIVEFRNWLDHNTDYKKETKSNIVSRVKRANNILPVVVDDVYIFHISLIPEFQAMSGSVKSQIRRAVKLYIKFMKEVGV